MIHRMGRWCWTTSTTIAAAQILLGDASMIPTAILVAAGLRFARQSVTSWSTT
jgi:hypothetical protein